MFYVRLKPTPKTSNYLQLWAQLLALFCLLRTSSGRIMPTIIMQIATKLKVMLINLFALICEHKLKFSKIITQGNIVVNSYITKFLELPNSLNVTCSDKTIRQIPIY